MTEVEWLQATDPQAMLSFLGAGASRRKLRLFACACYFRAHGSTAGEHHRGAYEIAVRLAEGWAANAERRQAETALMTVKPFIPSLNSLLSSNPFNAARYTARRASLSPAQIRASQLRGPGSSIDSEGEEVVRRECGVQAMLLRDIFGLLPFRPIVLDHAWQTTTVLSLVQQMYESRDFSPMPILADALQDAGCDNVDILAHCRVDGSHVRGCWVVDRLLARE